MSISADWYIFTIAKGSSQMTVGDSLPNVTVTTDLTGAGPSLEIGEKFNVGTTTFVYDGIATATDAATGDIITGFRAHSIKNADGTGKQAKVFFSQTDFDQDRHIDYVMTNDPETDKPVFVDGTVICFYPGTRIRTPDGEAAVETLAIGDLVLTADGQARPVRWVGRQTVATLFADPL
ncbi:Hint domain-containing protein, partial [Paracraurococcus ruber]